jgi:hypothetical protein
MARLIAILLTVALVALSGGGVAVAQGPVWAQAEALPEAGGGGTETAALPRSPTLPPPARRARRLCPPAPRRTPARRHPGPQARAPPTR